MCVCVLLTCMVSVILCRASFASGLVSSSDRALLYKPSAVTSFSCSSSLEHVRPLVNKWRLIDIVLLSKHSTPYCFPLSTSVWQRYFLALRWSGQFSRANSKSDIAFMMLPLLAYLHEASSQSWHKKFYTVVQTWQQTVTKRWIYTWRWWQGTHSAPRATSASTLQTSISKALLYSFMASTWRPCLKWSTPARTLQTQVDKKKKWRKKREIFRIRKTFIRFIQSHWNVFQERVCCYHFKAHEEDCFFRMTAAKSSFWNTLLSSKK